MYTFDSRVRYSETGEDGLLSLPAIVDYFQDVSTFQSEDLGIGIDFLKEKDLLWVMSAWQVVVHRYPALGEKIRIGTIPYELRGFMGLRNFFMDTEDGERLAEANSVWSLINHKKGVPVRVLPEMVEKYDVKERLQMDYAPRKIAVPQGGIRQEPFRVERQHLDGNHHVNNGQYISMAMAYLPENFAIRQMRAEYKKSALLHDIVVPIIVTEADRVTVSLCSEDEAPFVVVELTGRYGALVKYVPEAKTRNMFETEINSFVRCIRTGEKLPSHIDTAVLTSRIMQAIYDSAATHREVVLES